MVQDRGMNVVRWNLQGRRERIAGAARRPAGVDGRRREDVVEVVQLQQAGSGFRHVRGRPGTTAWCFGVGGHEHSQLAQIVPDQGSKFKGTDED
jgi:predicted alpha/beta-hydrolase family hydrolase